MSRIDSPRRSSIAELTPYGETGFTISREPLGPEELQKTRVYWQACNYVSLGMIYLLDNPILSEPLCPDQMKNRLLGHWGPSPGLSFIYIHLNRLIRKYDLASPGPAMEHPVSSGLCILRVPILRSILTRVRMYRACYDSSGNSRFPEGSEVTAHRRPPGSIHEGGELGSVLSHACGAAFDNPELIVAAVVGDGESETGPLATSWHVNKFLNPARNGAVLPILHLNGYKINNLTLLARISHEELEHLFQGYGRKPHFVEGSEPTACIKPWRRLWSTAFLRSKSSTKLPARTV
jgi:xylulose-5-phosphate/fructose-6-phosphate phosphoketolase